MGNISCKLLLIFSIALFMTGCSFAPVSQYDQQTENRLMSLNDKLAGLSVDLKNSVGLPESAYENHKDTYKSIHKDVAALQLRAMAIPKNKHTQDQVALLEENIQSVESLHKQGFGETTYGIKEVIALIGKDMKQALGAILKLEILKKRGIKTEPDSTEPQPEENVS